MRSQSGLGSHRETRETRAARRDFGARGCALLRGGVGARAFRYLVELLLGLLLLGRLDRGSKELRQLPRVHRPVHVVAAMREKERVYSSTRMHAAALLLAALLTLRSLLFKDTTPHGSTAHGTARRARRPSGERYLHAYPSAHGHGRPPSPDPASLACDISPLSTLTVSGAVHSVLLAHSRVREIYIYIYLYTYICILLSTLDASISFSS